MFKSFGFFVILSRFQFKIKCKIKKKKHRSIWDFFDPLWSIPAFDSQITQFRKKEKNEGLSDSGIGEIAAISPPSMDLLQSIGNASGSPSASILISISIDFFFFSSFSMIYDAVADLIMWKNKRGGILVLGSATLFWFLFEKCGYSFFPFLANIQLLVVVILFLWAKSAILFNRLLHLILFLLFLIITIWMFYLLVEWIIRPMPELPNLEITEASLLMVADPLRLLLNTLLSIARDIYLNRNATLLFRVRR